MEGASKRQAEHTPVADPRPPGEVRLFCAYELMFQTGRMALFLVDRHG